MIAGDSGERSVRVLLAMEIVSHADSDYGWRRMGQGIAARSVRLVGSH